MKLQFWWVKTLVNRSLLEPSVWGYEDDGEVQNQCVESDKSATCQTRRERISYDFGRNPSVRWIAETVFKLLSHNSSTFARSSVWSRHQLQQEFLDFETGRIKLGFECLSSKTLINRILIWTLMAEMRRWLDVASPLSVWSRTDDTAIVEKKLYPGENLMWKRPWESYGFIPDKKMQGRNTIT